MPAAISARLMENSALSTLARNCDSVLAELLPATARALWDLSEDEQKRPLLVLALSDLFGATVGRFAPDEMERSDSVRRRIHDLVGELLQSARRERIEIRDAFASAEQIQRLQQRLNAVPDIAKKRPKLFNRIQMSPENTQHFLITDFAIEVEAGAADQVKQAILDCGFFLRGDPVLERAGMKDRVRRLVEGHLQEHENLPRHAICFNLQDPADIHLLEVADDVASSGAGTLEGVGFIAGSKLPGARSLVIYLVPPADLRMAAEYDPSHPAIRDIQAGRCWFIYPEDEGESFYREFPKLHGKPA